MKALLIKLKYREKLEGLNDWVTEKIRIEPYSTEQDKNFILSIYPVGDSWINGNGAEVTVLSVDEANMEDLRALV